MARKNSFQGTPATAVLTAAGVLARLALVAALLLLTALVVLIVLSHVRYPLAFAPRG